MFKKSFLIHKYFNLRRLSSLRRPDVLDWSKQEQIIMEPFEYLQKVPSKHHKLTVSAFNHWLKVPQEKVQHIEETLQTLHTWSLLLDDIQDDSASRYGVPAAHCVFGVGFTVNAASNALVIVGKKMLELEHPLAPKICLDRIGELIQGQGIDLHWRDHVICPSEAEHIDMLRKKAASFFVLVVELLQLFSTNKKDCTNLAMNFGIYYPMVDDFYNLFQPKALKGLAGVKQDSDDHISCSDITESKITLPIIHAMQYPDVAPELTYILKQRTSDPELQKHFVSLLRKHGSDEYMRNVLRTLEVAIRREIDELGGNEILTNVMDDLGFQEQQSGQQLSKCK